MCSVRAILAIIKNLWSDICSVDSSASVTGNENSIGRAESSVMAKVFICFNYYCEP